MDWDNRGAITMPGYESIGKLLIILGAVMLIAGVLLAFWAEIPLLGKLPGDVSIQKGNVRFYFPIVTFLTISAILTIIVNVIIRLIGR